jgi:hypothetical protein
VASASYLQGQARLLLQWAAETKDAAQAERLRKRARQLFILAEVSADADAHFSFAVGEFNAQQMGLQGPARPVHQQQQQPQSPKPKLDE